jgi:hypothetical protein
MHARRSGQDRRVGREATGEHVRDRGLRRGSPDGGRRHRRRGLRAVVRVRALPRQPHRRQRRAKRLPAGARRRADRRDGSPVEHRGARGGSRGQEGRHPDDLLVGGDAGLRRRRSRERVGVPDPTPQHRHRDVAGRLRDERPRGKEHRPPLRQPRVRHAGLRRGGRADREERWQGRCPRDERNDRHRPDGQGDRAQERVARRRDRVHVPGEPHGPLQPGRRQRPRRSDLRWFVGRPHRERGQQRCTCQRVGHRRLRPGE